MENFVVSARKYRPATFDTVVGQSSITTTLKNAIRNNHLAQAFLFCGPRGVGKTTCARILAKTINCTNLTAETEACDQCDSCVSFKNGQSLNVYELDAASNNSVDDIRSLVDQVRFAPQLGQYKVYIIDEVHMLSQAAFNAFLKTLEEPPRHAIFILATTERHKILPTILSRCQIFNFNRIQVDDIAGHLAFIAKSENVTAEPDALHVIAQKADGALRDACSIFDQVVTFAGNNVSYKSVIENLNILDYDYYFSMMDNVLKEDIPNALLIYNEVLNNGFDGHVFVAGLAEHLRNLLVCKDPATLQLLEAGQNIREKYKSQSERAALPLLMRALGLVNRCDVAYKSARNPRLQVEFMLMQLCSLNSNSGDAEKKNDTIIPRRKKSGDETQQQEAAPLTAQPENKTTVQQPVNPVQQPVQQPVANTAPVGTRKLTSMGSINAFKQGNAAKEKEQAAGETISITDLNQPQQPFTAEALQQCWTGFTDELKNQGLASVLRMNKPELQENYAVQFLVANAAAEEQLNSIKPDLLAFLRTRLNNKAIMLTIMVNKAEAGRKMFTDQEKYKRMAELNPEIEKLRKAFDLTLD